MTSLWKVSEKRLLRGAPSRDVVARCSTIAFTISSKKNQADCCRSWLPWLDGSSHCIASCSCTSFATVTSENDMLHLYHITHKKIKN